MTFFSILEAGGNILLIIRTRNVILQTVKDGQYFVVFF